MIRARSQERLIREGADVQMQADAGKKKRYQQFSYSVCEIVNSLGNGFGKRHAGQESADNRGYANMDCQHRQV